MFLRRKILKPAMTTRKQQSGSFLLEALISALLFMVGLIALLGVSTQAVNQVGQSKYRNDASYLASEVIGEMWITPGTAAAYVASVNYTNWTNRVAAEIPGGTVAVVLTGTTQVALTISWPDKKDPLTRHLYQTTANVK